MRLLGSEAVLTAERHGRSLAQFYYTNRGTGRRWYYWAIPIIAVGVFVFIVAIVIWLRRRRQAQLHMVQPQYAQQNYPPPVTGYPTPPPAYSTPQYASEYNNYGSVPPQGGGSGPSYPTPFPTQLPKPAGNVEMGYPQRY